MKKVFAVLMMLALFSACAVQPKMVTQKMVTPEKPEVVEVMTLTDRDNFMSPIQRTDSVTIDLPLFNEPVTWEWRFIGLPYDCASLAKGEIISSSAQYGYTSVETNWIGGESYTLSNARTLIKANGLTIYCD